MITSQNITAHEWIGLKVRITKSTDPTLRGLQGVVRDETMNTFTIEANGKFRQVQKQETVFLAELPTENVEVDGSHLRFRPEDRVKKGMRKW
ncbi:ribonuclease P protein component 1 [Candidatus Bathyarchaeota archaeon]|nr:MAG: ribonuclease P protein component 1 [Candidatus Bathyarchaeota archaeon]